MNTKAIAARATFPINLALFSGLAALMTDSEQF